jgi:hypothetical protein
MRDILAVRMEILIALDVNVWSQKNRWRIVWHSLCLLLFSAQKSLDFQGPPLHWPLAGFARIKITTSRAI